VLPVGMRLKESSLPDQLGDFALAVCLDDFAKT
jgi:hypothetical protein